MNVCRKFVGKLNWLAANASPDLAIYALKLAKREKKATIKVLREINSVEEGKRKKVEFYSQRLERTIS